MPCPLTGHGHRHRRFVSFKMRCRRLPVPGLVARHVRASRRTPMTRALIRICGALAICGSLVATPDARGDERSAEAILADIDAVQAPRLDASKTKDGQYVQQS